MKQAGNRGTEWTPNRRQMILRLLGLAGLIQATSAGNFPPAIGSRRFSVPIVNSEGKVVTHCDASALYFAEPLGDGVELEMALIPGGRFLMGSNDPEFPGQPSEQPIHEVSIKPFALGVFPVTRAQWRRVSAFPRVSTTLHEQLPGSLPPEVEVALPIDFVSWAEMEEFCKRLRQYTGKIYRLPSEAEWEYACRAGTSTKYHFGDGISQSVATYSDGIENPKRVTPVGVKNAPNRYGLHDMHGNVLECCADRAHDSYKGAPADGSAWISGGDSSSRIWRGGMYLWNSNVARSAARTDSDLRATYSGQGFRVALDLSDVDLLDPKISNNGVTSAASGLSQPLAPGKIITIKGINVGPVVSESLSLDEQNLLRTELAGIRVLFDGVAAPLLYVSADQVNAIVPYETAIGQATQIMIDSRGQTSAPVALSTVPASPSLFTADSSGTGQGAILNQDGSLNAMNNPAPKGSIVTLYATGEGQTRPKGINGALAGPSLPVPVLPVQVFIGGIRAELQYAGAAPGQIAGLLQVNARVPESVAAGQLPIVLKVGEASSQDGVVVSVG